MRRQLGRPPRIRSSQFEANAAFMQIHWVRQQLKASGDKALLISEIKAARQADEPADFRHLDEIHSAFSPSYRGDIFQEREAAWKSRNQVKQRLPRTGLRLQILLSTSIPPSHQAAPHPSIASRKQIFRRCRRAPTTVVNSCSRAMKRKLLDQEWGHGGECTLVYSGNDKHCKFRGRQNDRLAGCVCRGILDQKPS